jgi:hypothetical protein
MAENVMAAPYANTKYSRKLEHGDQVSRKFRWGSDDPVTVSPVTKGLMEPTCTPGSALIPAGCRSMCPDPVQ